MIFIYFYNSPDDIESAGGINVISGNIRYIEETDYIQVKYNNEWVDWQKTMLKTIEVINDNFTFFKENTTDCIASQAENYLHMYGLNQSTFGRITATSINSYDLTNISKVIFTVSAVSGETKSFGVCATKPTSYSGCSYVKSANASVGKF